MLCNLFDLLTKNSLVEELFYKVILMAHNSEEYNKSMKELEDVGHSIANTLIDIDLNRKQIFYIFKEIISLPTNANNHGQFKYIFLNTFLLMYYEELTYFVK